MAVIERRYVGGSCPNVACLPSKNIIHSAKVADYFRRSAEFGIHKEGWKIDMAGVRERKRRMVDGLMQVQHGRYKATGTELVMGEGRFVAPKTLEVKLNDGGTRTLRAERVIISTGSRASVEDIPGLRASHPLTHVEALELDRIPEHLLIVGGGYTSGWSLRRPCAGLAARSPSSSATKRLAHREDADVSEALLDLCRHEGIEVCTGAIITRVEGISGDGVRLHATRDGEEIELACTDLLVASGRTPNTDGIGLELAGVETTEHGYIKVNERLETTAPECLGRGRMRGQPGVYPRGV